MENYLPEVPDPDEVMSDWEKDRLEAEIQRLYDQGAFDWDNEIYWDNPLETDEHE